MSTKSELKENVLASKVEVGLKWALENRSTVLTALGVMVGVVLIGSVFVIRRKELAERNWTRLSQVQALISQQQYGPAKNILREIQSAGPGQPTGRFATYQLGEAALGEKNYDEAIKFFSEVAQTAGTTSPLTPLALSNLGYSHEQKGDYAAASQTYRQFIQRYPDHFLAPRVQLALGRSLLLGGESAAAKEALEQLIDLYPTSEWAERARGLLSREPARGGPPGAPN